MTVARAQEACAVGFDLKMERATLNEIVACIKPVLENKRVSIEVRKAKPVQVSFDLKGSSVGKVLTSVAALAGSNLYVLSGGLLITPASQLTEAEKLELQQGQGGEWASNTNAVQHHGWTLKGDSTPSPDEQRAADACAFVLDLKLKNGALNEALNDIKRSLPDPAVPIQVRGASPIQASFDLQRISVGSVLAPIVALGGCEVYVLSSGVLISPADQLTESEKLELRRNQGGVWQDNLEAGGFYTSSLVVDGMRHPGWSIQKEARKLFSGVVAQEAVGAPTGTTTFGNFSLDSQAMLQQMANWVVESSRATDPRMPSLKLTSASSISVVSSPEAIQITLKDVASDPKPTTITMTTYIK